MKSLTLLYAFAVLSISTTCQDVIKYSILGKTNKEIIPIGYEKLNFSIEIGKEVRLINLTNDFAKQDRFELMFINNEKIFYIPVSDLGKITFEKPQTIDALWQQVLIKSDFAKMLKSKGFQYDFRKELEGEVLELLNKYENYIGFFDDEYLEDYIQALLYQIHPITLNDGRPGNLSVKIFKDPDPNAFCTPTGVILISTGLLSIIGSEDELIAVLAHEITHFVLDHQVINIRKTVSRKNIADFLATFATLAVASAEANSNYYSDGSFTLTTAVLSYTIGNAIVARLGSNYSMEQEWEADSVTSIVLSVLKKDSKALASVLTRLKNYYILNGEYLALSGSGTHPKLEDRIMKIGSVYPSQFESTSYDRVFSLINTFNATSEFNLNHLKTALSISERNIKSGAAIEDDYIIKAMCLRLLYNTLEKNQEALNLINKAKILNVVPRIDVYKEEGITLMRMGKEKEAGEAFKNYLKNLEMSIDKSEYNINEIEWTKKMVYKVSGL